MMFPALLIARSLVPVRVKTETSFAADDPWNGNRRTSYTVEAYLKLFKGSKPPKTKPFGAIYMYGIRSDIDGVERMLPDSLSELWRTQRLPGSASTNVEADAAHPKKGRLPADARQQSGVRHDLDIHCSDGAGSSPAICYLNNCAG